MEASPPSGSDAGDIAGAGADLVALLLPPGDVPGDIAGAGDQAGFTGYRLTAFSEHILGKVNTTVPGGLLAAQRSAPVR